MNTDEEMLALAHELMACEGLPLAVALDAAALALDDASDFAAAWDRTARQLRDAELAAFAQEWDARVAELQALVS